MISTTQRRLRLSVEGVVQGVGFRPFVYRTAGRLGLAGFVRNTSGGVEIEAEGYREHVDALIEALRSEPPPLASVERIDVTRLEPTGATGFGIVESKESLEARALISPDQATCGDCLRELFDPDDRRHRYPFINCTNCGPRFTIVLGVPYDRRRTTMSRFDLCRSCAGEYKDPSDRRFHAEPNACPVCGPRLSLVSPTGEILAARDDAVKGAQERLAAGRVLAIKGIGGFHLACDAANGDAVSKLRSFKRRPHKPMAVMCSDPTLARELCEISPDETRELSSPARPILLLRRRPAGAAAAAIAPGVAPGMEDVGVMLPYAPLHHLLLDGDGPACLVMTSGNRRDEPIVTENSEAIANLGAICDALLLHDRPIENRCDDSVGFVEGGRVVLTRRSRGFAPPPVLVKADVRPTLALGALLNNVFAIGDGHRVFLSQHIGDVENCETLSFLKGSIEKLLARMAFHPEVVAHDMHPDLLTTRLAGELAGDRETVAVQHHHAHFASALAAAGVTDEAQGLVLDGTGWGPDGSIWGGEVLVGSAAGFRRAGHLRPLPLPGGEAAIRSPIRLATAYLHVMVPSAKEAPLDLWNRISPVEAAAVHRMVDRRFNTPMTTSAGRLFDAVSSLLGIRDHVTYEGQAAIELEQLARKGNAAKSPSLEIAVLEADGGLVLDPAPLFIGLTQAILDNVFAADLGAGFHMALARSLALACARVRDAGDPGLVALCGGVFQNRLLTRLTAHALDKAGLETILPGLVPVNDGGLALGQVMVAGAPRKRESGNQEVQ
jgi:hydrogenase maturation protein HypF